MVITPRGLEGSSPLTGKGVCAAVFDTGMAPHPDLEGRLVVFRDFVRGKRRAYDDNGHGTHVSGIICGSGATSGGRFRGIAPECGIAALKVLDWNGNGNLKVVLSGIRWLLAHFQEYGIRIVNISVGAIPKEAEEESALINAVEQLWEAGLVVIVAAGNRGPVQGSVTTPGISRKVITVGCCDDIHAVDVGGQMLSDYSGRGPVQSSCVVKPEVVTYGSHVVSCNAMNRYHPKPYTVKSGTSMATPKVTGAIALLLEKYPQLKNWEVKLKLYESCDDIGLPKSHQGWGRLNIERLVE